MVLLAERLRGADGTPIERSPAAFASVGDYRLHLHTAIYLASVPEDLCAPDVPRAGVDDGGPAVLHATACAGETCLWEPALFAHHYRVVAIKQIL